MSEPNHSEEKKHEGKTRAGRARPLLLRALFAHRRDSRDLGDGDAGVPVSHGPLFEQPHLRRIHLPRLHRQDDGLHGPLGEVGIPIRRRLQRLSRLGRTDRSRARRGEALCVQGRRARGGGPRHGGRRQALSGFRTRVRRGDAHARQRGDPHHAQLHGSLLPARRILRDGGSLERSASRDDGKARRPGGEAGRRHERAGG